MLARVCSVSYLNSTPLIWGLVHGIQRGEVDLRFELPSVCAALLASSEADVGLVPVIELERQPLTAIPALGIACTGAVRSILLVSHVEAREIRTLAADASSRTSVVMAQILLQQKFGARLQVTAAAPEIDSMLRAADAGLVIGDPALLLNTEAPGLHVYDLGAEWLAWTGLPMVFAVWAAREGFDWHAVKTVLDASWEYGRGRIAEIAGRESPSRGIPEDLGRRYLTRNIEFELSDNHQRGLALFRQLARVGGFV